MIKYLSLFTAIILIIVFSVGCTAEGSTENGAPDVEEIDASANTLGVDITGFDSYTAHDVAEDITENPTKYLGTNIKLKGNYEVQNNYNNGGYVHAVSINDLDVCCIPVIEFIWDGEHSFPDDYPDLYDEIEIEGILKSYQEEGSTYYYLDINDIRNLTNDNG